MGSRSNTKVLRPEQCVVDGKLCAACAEDIESEQEINKIEKQIKELESRLKRVHIKRRALRTAMNEIMIPSSINSRRKSSLIFSFNTRHLLCASTHLMRTRYISVRCARNGGSWLGQHQGFGLRSTFDVLRLVNMMIIYPDLLTNG